VRVRAVQPTDIPTLIRFIHELAEYEREPDAVHLTAEQLESALFAQRPHLFGHVAELDEQVVGMALWFLNFSTWEGTHGVYLEDLYVTPSARGHGCGQALLSELAQICLNRGYARLELAVLDWNEPAIGFYTAHGARQMDEWTVQRFSGQALQELSDLG
jgi:GNAT superfamily N-acetyltransferase